MTDVWYMSVEDISLNCVFEDKNETYESFFDMKHISQELLIFTL
jgi:hypothetical protein